jgi:ABC-2 type transport system permease protein
VLHQFMDGISGAKIAVQVALDELPLLDQQLVGRIVQSYLQGVSSRTGDLREELVQSVQPKEKPKASSLLASIIGPIMAGVMVFYAFYTGAARAQSFLEEEEGYTLQRLFTTPTPLTSILTGKFLQIFLTVLVQVVVLIGIARLLFSIRWGPPANVALLALATVVAAASFGIFLVSLMTSTKQGGVLFGGVLTVSGMLGMISIFAVNSPNAARLSNTVALLVPQGWAVRGFQQCIGGASFNQLLPGALALIGWSLVMFSIGLFRFQRRYR